MSNQLFIITGASRGLGLALAHQLTRPRRKLLCMARRSSDALAIYADQNKAELEQWQVDLTDPQPVADRLETWLGGLSPASFSDVTLINNAGSIPRIGPLSTLDGPDIARALRVGLEAPMLLSSAFLRATQNWTVPRRLLNISSGLGRRAMASQATYCAAKAGMDHFTRSVALDEIVRLNGAKVCSLAPGVIDTDMQVQLRGARPNLFPDQPGFLALKSNGQLASPEQAAQQVLAYLQRPDFGANPVADVRDP